MAFGLSTARDNWMKSNTVYMLVSKSFTVVRVGPNVSDPINDREKNYRIKFIEQNFSENGK